MLEPLATTNALYFIAYTSSVFLVCLVMMHWSQGQPRDSTGQFVTPRAPPGPSSTPNSSGSRKRRTSDALAMEEGRSFSTENSPGLANSSAFSTPAPRRLHSQNGSNPQSITIDRTCTVCYSLDHTARTCPGRCPDCFCVLNRAGDTHASLCRFADISLTENDPLPDVLKRKKGEWIAYDVRRIMLRVLSVLLMVFKLPKTLAYTVAAVLLGCSKRTLQTMMDIFERDGEVPNPVDRRGLRKQRRDTPSDWKSFILQKVTDVNMTMIRVTVKHIRDAMVEEFQRNFSLKLVRAIMKGAGLQYKMIGKKKTVVPTPHLLKLRNIYLRERRRVRKMEESGQKVVVVSALLNDQKRRQTNALTAKCGPISTDLYR